MRFKLIYGDVGRIRDRAGQLGKTGEYWMGRMRVVWIINSELHGCSPDLCRLRPRRLGLNEQALIMCWRIREFFGVLQT
jgi:hypothetical protein